MSALQRDQHTDNEHDDDDIDDDDDPNGDDNEPVFNLPPPPQGNHPSAEELEKSLHAWSLEHGYEMVRRASKKNGSGALYKRYFHCSRHGKLANTGKLTDQMRVRAKRKSNRTGCPMSLAAVAVDPSNPAGQWQIRHRKTHHNHGPLDALTLVGHRRRARVGGVEKVVDGLFAIGTPTPQVLQFLQRTNPGGLFTRTDVANMKLKYKKNGTCVKDPSRFTREGPGGGFPSACTSCRVKKTKCDSVRPVCGTCAKTAGVQCVYDHEPGAAHPNRRTPIRQPQQTTASDTPQQTISDTPQQGGRRQTTLGTQRAVAEQILADIRNFQADQVRPRKLDLSSSSVEVLAQSSCGNGVSYKYVPILDVASDWHAYSVAFLEASLKENTQDVLTGAKTEPVEPDAPDGGEPDVEEWNEYVKQLAIYKRRNSMLLGFLWGTLAPSLRARVQYHNRACEAWKTLEEICSPRGSNRALRLFNDLHAVTLQACGGRVEEYVRRLDAAYTNLASLKTDPSITLQPGNGSVPPAPADDGTDVFTDESMCFLFLRNLDDGRWKKWVDTLCSTSNVGGYGTGAKLGFRDVTRKAIEWEQMQGQNGGVA